MKKMFFICCIAVSALALATSANTNHYKFNSVSNNDTTPPMMMTDSMHHGSMKMHHNKNKMMKDSTAGMTQSTDSASTAPPKQ